MREEVLGECPKCNEGHIVIKRSVESKKFAGCDRYPECDNAHWVPHLYL